MPVTLFLAKVWYNNNSRKIWLKSYLYCEFGVGLYCKHGKVWFPWLYDSTSMTFRHWECKFRKRYEWDWIIHFNWDMYYSYKETGNFIRIILVYKIIIKFTNKMQQLSSLSEYHCTFKKHWTCSHVGVMLSCSVCVFSTKEWAYPVIY